MTYVPKAYNLWDEADRIPLATHWQPAPPIAIVPKDFPIDDYVKARTSRFSKSLPDVMGLTNSIIQQDLDYTQALVVENDVDQLVDWAPNVLAFCADSRFLGWRPYARQAQLLLQLFEDFCPRCSNKEWVSGDFPVNASLEEIQSAVALLDRGKCTSCDFTRGQGRATGEFKDPYEMICVIGQRSGKSAVSAAAICYLIHQYCEVATPWKAFELTPGQVMDFTVVATTVGQSERALWSTFRKMLLNSFWFKQYKAVCDEYGQKQGVRETVKVRDMYINFEHKGLLIYNAANDHNALRGSTRMGFAIDELAFFASGDEKSGKRSNGPETYTSLDNSCETLREHVDEVLERNPETTLPIPRGFVISSPKAMNDPIMTLHREKQGDEKAVLRHFATWQFNPKMTKKRLSRQLKQPNGWRDFGAQPPLTDNALISKTGIVKEAFSSPLAVDPRYHKVLQPTALGLVDEERIRYGRGVRVFKVADVDEEYEGGRAPPAVSEKLLEQLGPYRETYIDLMARPAHLCPHILGIDIGSTTNSMGIAGMCLVDDGKRLMTDFLLQIKPQEKVPINIAMVFERLITPLVERLHCVGVFYDQWQSLHEIQKLAIDMSAMGPLHSTSEVRRWRNGLRADDELPPFIAERTALSVADANLLVTRIEQGDCLFPPMEVPMLDVIQNKSRSSDDTPFTQLAVQMATVRVKGNRLLKPADRDDDLFRAWSHAAIKAFTDETVMAMLNDTSVANTTPEKTQLRYAVRARSGSRAAVVTPTSPSTNKWVVARQGGKR